MGQRKSGRIKKLTGEVPNLQLASLFRQKRLELGLSLESVADYLKISPAQLKLYESGERSIPLQYIYGLSNCLGIDPDVILKLIERCNDEF